MSYLFKTISKINDSLKKSNTFLDNSRSNNNINSGEISLRKENYYLTERIKQLENEINMKEEIIEKLFKEARDQKEEQRKIENEIHSQVLYYKRLHESGVAKESAASSIIKLNEIQQNYIKQLENKIDEVKKSYEQKIQSIELENEEKYSRLKEKMMNNLKNSTKMMAKNNEENLELNTKLTILYKNQMLNELENQSHQIEELIKEREKKNKEIYILKEELKFHKKVEGIIKNKNSKYLKIINQINDRISQQPSTDYNNNLENFEFKDKNKNNERRFNAGRTHSEKINKNKQLINMFNNSLPTHDNNYIDYTKETLKNCESLQNIKDFNNTIKDKKSSKKQTLFFYDNTINAEYNNEIYHNLFKEIIILINQAKEKMIINKKINDISKSNLFTDNFNFNILTYEQKYELLIEMMKEIFRFINLDIKKDSDLIKIKNKIDLIKFNDNYSSNNNENNPSNMNKTYRLTNYIGKTLNKFNSKSQRKFPNIHNKKSDIFSKILISKNNQNKENNNLISSFRDSTPNPLIRFIHLEKGSSRSSIDDIKNATFFK